MHTLERFWKWEFEKDVGESVTCVFYGLPTKVVFNTNKVDGTGLTFDSFQRKNLYDVIGMSRGIFWRRVMVYKM